jgi:pentatricopeptide repeat protein
VKKVQRQLPKSFYSDIRLVTSLFDALIKCGNSSHAELLLSKLPKSPENYGNLMNGYNLENNPSKTLDLFHQMIDEKIEINSIIYLCLVNALSQLGDDSICQSIIEQIPQTFLQNHQLQNALIDMWVSLK